MFKLTKLINWRNHIIKHLKKNGLLEFRYCQKKDVISDILIKPVLKLEFDKQERIHATATLYI